MSDLGTPPAHVRMLEARIEALEADKQSAYAAVRDLRLLVEANHIAIMHSLGQIAGAVLKK